MRRSGKDCFRTSCRSLFHPAQVPIINEVFTPSPEEIARARAVVAAFDANPGKGALAVGGVMHDRPHLARAQRMLAHAAGAEKSL